MNQLKIGRAIEKEHVGTYKFISRYYKSKGKMPPKNTVFTHIAKDHLKENKNYYTKLRKARL